jgi:hypothetical protein
MRTSMNCGRPRLQNVPVGWRQLMGSMRLDGSRIGQPAKALPYPLRAGQRCVTADHGHMFCERRVNCEIDGRESGIADLAAVTLVTWR